MSLRRTRRLADFYLAAFSFAALTLTSCRTHDFPQYPPNYREYAYVTNGDSGTVTVLDVVNLRIDREIPVGEHPVAVAISPTRNEVYIVNKGGATGSLSVINAEKNALAATIQLRREPISIDVDQGGKLAYIANSGSNAISIVDLVARREIGAIGVGDQPVVTKISPDGKTLVVANLEGNSASVIDLPSGQLRAVFEACPGANDVAILPDSSKAFVACSRGHQVMAIALERTQAISNQTSLKEAASTQPGSSDRVEALMDVGHAPVQLALKPDGGELFVSNSLSDTISEVVTGTDDVGGAFLIGDNPVRGLVSRDNVVLYVANYQSQFVTAYSIDDGKRLYPSIHVGDGPLAMAFSAEGNLLFVVDNRSSDIAVVRTLSNSLFTLFPAGRSPNAIAVKSFRVQ